MHISTFRVCTICKTVSLPMSIVLMDVARYSYWLLHHHMAPKQQTGIPVFTPISLSYSWQHAPPWSWLGSSSHF
jgi:hypothetical protein